MSELVIAERSDLVAIADAIRNKTGSSDALTLSQMKNEINGIKTGYSGSFSIESSLTTATFIINSHGMQLGEIDY